MEDKGTSDMRSWLSAGATGVAGDVAIELFELLPLLGRTRRLGMQTEPLGSTQPWDCGTSGARRNDGSFRVTTFWPAWEPSAMR